MEEEQVIAARQQLGVTDDGIHCQWAICTFSFFKQLNVLHHGGLATVTEGCLLIHFGGEHQCR